MPAASIRISREHVRPTVVVPAGLRAFLASILLFSGACSPAHSRRTSLSPAAAVSGFYEGGLESREHGEVPFSTNLRDENGSVAGTLSTPLGDFPVSQERLAPEEIALRFVLGDGEVGTIAARWGAGEIRGNWKLSDDGGAIAMRRVGPPKPSVEPARPTLDLSAEEWREDLHHLATELPRRHGNAFHRVSRAAFEKSVRALEAKLPSLEGDAVFAALGQIVASVGDGHIYLEMPETFHRIRSVCTRSGRR